MTITRVIAAALMFAATWLLWSGHYTPLLLFFGAASTVAVLLLGKRIGLFEVESYMFHLAPRLPGYWLWLLKEVVKSNLEVAKIVLHPRLPIGPTVISVDASRLPAISQVLLANSITLTPGTISIDVDRGIIEVHCLTQETARGLKGGEMLRRAAKVAEG